MKFSFLLCSERSGSNLILNMLNAHPSVCGPAPNHSIRAFAQNEKNYGDLSNEDNWECLIKDFTQYITYQLGNWQTDFSIEDVNKIPTNSVISLLKYRFIKEAKHQGKEILFIKENKIYNFYEFIKKHFANAPLVYQVRDPRDMALSWKKSNNHPGFIKKAVDQWLVDQNKFLRIISESSTPYIRYSYEDLLSHPERTLKNICESLGIDFSNKMLEFYNNENTISNAEKIKNWENLKKPLLKNNRNKFLTELTKNEILYIEYHCKNLMDTFGYKLEFEVATKEDIYEITKNIDSDKTKTPVQLSEEELGIRMERTKIINKIISRKL